MLTRIHKGKTEDILQAASGVGLEDIPHLTQLAQYAWMH